MPSEIRVDSIGGNSPVGVAVSLTNGLTIATGFALTCIGNINASSTVTASSFVGNGAGLVNLNATSLSKAAAYSILF